MYSLYYRFRYFALDGLALMFLWHQELVQSALLESNTGRDDRILYNKLVQMSGIWDWKGLRIFFIFLENKLQCMSLLYYGMVRKGDGFFSFTWVLVSAIRVFLCFYLMSAKMQKSLFFFLFDEWKLSLNNNQMLHSSKAWNTIPTGIQQNHRPRNKPIHQQTNCKPTINQEPELAENIALDTQHLLQTATQRFKISNSDFDVCGFHLYTRDKLFLRLLKCPLAKSLARTSHFIWVRIALLYVGCCDFSAFIDCRL